MALTIITLVFIVPLFFILYEIAVAPEGWEDDEGFHLGKKD